MSQNSKGRVVEEMPATEVVAKAKRRQYTTEYKLRILQEARACKGGGEIGALLYRQMIWITSLIQLIWT